MKVGADPLDRARSRAAGICRRAVAAAVQRAAHGLAVRQAAHAGGTRPGLGEAVRELRPSAGRRGLARPGAPRRRQGWPRAGGEAAISRHAVGRRGRPDAAQDAVLGLSPHRRVDRHQPRSSRRSATRIREELDYGREARHALLYKIMLDGEPLVRVPEVEPALSTQASAVHDLARGRPAARLPRPLAGGAQPHRHGHVPRLVVALRPVTASSTAIRISATTPCSRRTASPAASTCSTMAASASSRRTSSPAWSISSMACARTTATGSSRPMRAGASSGSRNELIEALNIWARFIYAPLLDDRVRTIADGVAPAEYGRREAFQRASGAEGEGPGDGAARIRLHGPRRDRARRRCSCISRPR